ARTRTSNRSTCTSKPQLAETKSAKVRAFLRATVTLEICALRFARIGVVSIDGYRVLAVDDNQQSTTSGLRDASSARGNESRETEKRGGRLSICPGSGHAERGS